MSKLNNKALTATIIRAADYLPKEGDYNPESYELTQSDRILYALFGDTPDYSMPKFEKLWQDILDAQDEDTIAWCLAKGIDLLDNDKKPVPGWRDIAVMLKAIDKGWLKLADDDDEGPLLDTEIEHE
jgi:hypothetical protein